MTRALNMKIMTTIAIAFWHDFSARFIHSPYLTAVMPDAKYVKVLTGLVNMP
jgi:hypothetical protein